MTPAQRSGDLQGGAPTPYRATDDLDRLGLGENAPDVIAAGFAEMLRGFRRSEFSSHKLWPLTKLR
jgi:hypothetical protein